MTTVITLVIPSPSGSYDCNTKQGVQLESKNRNTVLDAADAGPALCAFAKVAEPFSLQC